MGLGRWTGRAILGSLALAAAALMPAASASAAAFPNACINSVTSNNSEIGVDMTADASGVGPGGSVTLSNIDQSLNVPPDIFLAGYRIFLYGTGPLLVPADVETEIAASNTVEGQQKTSTESGSISTTINDPTPGNRNSGDESADPGSMSVSYDDQTWTAGTGEINLGKPKLNKKKGTAKLPVEVPGAGLLELEKTSKVKGKKMSVGGAGTVKLPVKARGKAKKKLNKRGKTKVKVSVSFSSDGAIEFREATVTPLEQGSGGVIIDALIGGALPIQFHCSPGTVAGDSPGVITFDDPAVPFATAGGTAPGGSVKEETKLKLKKKKKKRKK